MAAIHAIMAGNSGPFVYNKTFSSDFSTPYNLYNDLIANGWDSAAMVIATITINSGVVVSSNTTASAAFTIGAIPSYCNVTITNNGYIVGMGGAGGSGGGSGVATQASGSPGGTALAYGVTPTGLCVVKFYNNGILAGGGGGGGGAYSGAQSYRGPGGGGGQTGRTNSAGGATDYGSYQGTFSGPGPALVPSGNGNSGAGGTWGNGGEAGWAWPGDYVVTGGGAGGNSVTGNAGFNFLATGTRYGAIS